MVRLAVGAGIVVSLLAGPAHARDLSFEDRVRAQEAIERVYYSHQIGAKKPFEQAVPRAVLERKVETYLKQSRALEIVWHTPVTGGMLRAEMRRQASATQMPDRLGELYAALGNDPFLVEECLARPALVDRLVRSFFESDERIHGAGTKTWSSWWREASPGFDRAVTASAATEDVLPPLDDAAGCKRDNTWTPTTTSNGPEERTEHSEVWTGSKMIVWGGASSQTWLDDGSLYDPAIDAWTAMSTDGAPHGRQAQATVWTGTEMIVWGGWYFDTVGHFVNDGGRYDPVADTWTPISTAGAPSGRIDATGVWTGSEMIVWGGLEGITEFGDGARYSPDTDTWAPVSLTGAPSPRSDHSAVWTGSEMIVWGGSDEVLVGGGFLGDGRRYDPAIDQWTPTSQVGAPGMRAAHTAVWTGSRMIVWGGTRKLHHQGLQTGGIYEPSTDTWTVMSTLDVPRGRLFHTAVWTGSEMIVWGGLATLDALQSGGRYDPAADTWRSTRKQDAPSPRSHHRAVWTGELMIVWGGDDYRRATVFNTGGAYHACP